MIGRPSVRKIVSVCARYYGMPDDALLSRNMLRKVAHVRHIAVFVAVRRFGYSLTKVAAVINRDRSTLIHACRVIQRMRSDDERLSREVDEIIAASFEQLSHVPTKSVNVIAPSSIDAITRYRARGFTIGRISRFTGLDEATVASVLSGRNGVARPRA